MLTSGENGFNRVSSEVYQQKIVPYCNISALKDRNMVLKHYVGVTDGLMLHSSLGYIAKEKYSFNYGVKQATECRN